MAPNMWLNWKTIRPQAKAHSPQHSRLTRPRWSSASTPALDSTRQLLRVGDELGISYPDIQEEFLTGQPGAACRPAQAGRPGRTWPTAPSSKSSRRSSACLPADRSLPVRRLSARFLAPVGRYPGKRRQRAEREAAAKTKIKIIFPLVLCIFPCIFIVLLAPAILSIMQGMQGMNGNQ